MTVRVSKATPKLTMKVSKGRTATVSVSLPGYPRKLTGTVKLKVAGKTVTRTVRNGKVKVKLPKVSRTGRVTVTASYTPTSALKSSIKPGTKRVKVRFNR